MTRLDHVATSAGAELVNLFQVCDGPIAQLEVARRAIYTVLREALAEQRERLLTPGEN